MSNFSLASLARLALKNHQELQSLFHSPASAPALQLALQLAGGDTGLEFSCAANNALMFTMSQGTRRITVRVAPRPTSLETAELTVTMQHGPYGVRTATFTGKSFMDLKAEPAFGELVEAAKQHLSQYFKAYGPEQNQKAQEPSPTSVAESATGPATTEQPPGYLTYVIKRENKPNLKFNGKEVVSVATAIRKGRQHIYSVYQTEGGKRIGVKQGISLLFNEKDIVTAEVLDTDQALIEFFGYNDLAKALYERLTLTQFAEEVIA